MDEISSIYKFKGSSAHTDPIILLTLQSDTAPSQKKQKMKAYLRNTLCITELVRENVLIFISRNMRASNHVHRSMKRIFVVVRNYQKKKERKVDKDREKGKIKVARSSPSLDEAPWKKYSEKPIFIWISFYFCHGYQRFTVQQLKVAVVE